MKQFSFYKPYKNYLKHGSEGQVLITDVDSEGDSLQELLDNATVGLEDMHGNTLQHIKLEELSEPDYTRVSGDVKRIWALQAAQDAVKPSKLEWASNEEDV